MAGDPRRQDDLGTPGKDGLLFLLARLGEVPCAHCLGCLSWNLLTRVRRRREEKPLESAHALMLVSLICECGWEAACDE